MGFHKKNENLIKEVYDVLSLRNPMTVRQVYYQLVSRQVLKNDKSEYQRVSNLLVKLRKEGIIPWNWIEDRLRKPRGVNLWEDLGDFLETVKSAYQKDPWPLQDYYIEVWLEKDALSGIFERILSDYRIILNVGRGYDGWSSIYQTALRLNSQNKPCIILYFGDFDPSGEDMVRSLRERLAFFDCRPQIIKSALNFDDVKKYKLPCDFTKINDRRRARFVERYGDVAVELDALPIDILTQRIESEIKNFLDIERLNHTLLIEEQEIRTLESFFS